MDRQETSMKDNEGLEPLRAGPFAFGVVDAVNGPGAHECSDYPVTHAELLVLARYWAGVRLEIHLESYFDCQITSSGIRLGPYADRRLDRIAAVIGDEAVSVVCAELEDKNRRKLGVELWDAFVHSNSDVQTKLQDEILATSDYLDLKGKDKAKLAQIYEYLRVNPSRYQIDDDGDLWAFRLAHDEDKLLLSVTTPASAWKLFPEYSAERPASWRAPFGIGN